MKLYLDTANIDQIREIARMGVLSGVTTNPSLMAKEQGVTYKDRILEICEAVNGPVSAECTSQDVAGLVEEGRNLAKWHKNVIVKVPCDQAGLEATSILSKEGVRINMTLVFSPNQALLAATAGAAYASPFVGRLDDAGHDGMQIVRDIAQIYDTYGFKTEIIAASLRHPMHVVDAALAGSHIGTLPYSVFKAMIKHPLTDAGIERFLADSKSYIVSSTKG